LKSGVLSASITAVAFFFLALIISNTEIFGNDHNVAIEILISFLIWTVIVCSYLIVNAIKENSSSN